MKWTVFYENQKGKCTMARQSKTNDHHDTTTAPMTM